MPFTARLTKSGAFIEDQLESWVEQCAMAARNANVSNPCIVILHNVVLPNSPVFLGNDANGYHWLTGDGTPYCYVTVSGQNLTIGDLPNQFYAMALSHEIAEMVVDPYTNHANPEVCDACSGNCSQDLFANFDQNGVFLGGRAVSGFAFFINPVVNANATLDSHQCVVPAGDAQNACIYPPPFVTGELLSYGDVGTRGNVSNPVVVGFDGWLAFRFLFADRNNDRIYAVNQNGELLSYGDAGTQGNVSDPVVVGFSGWLAFEFLFGGKNAAGQDGIYAVNQNGELLFYTDDGTPGNVSDPVVVGRSGWLAFKFLFGGKNAAGQDGIYAVNQNGELLFYTDDGTQYNVSDPVMVGRSGWLAFKFLFGGKNAAGRDGIYAVNQNGELLFYTDDGTQYNVSDPVVVGLGGWSAFESLFAGRNAAGEDRIYAVAA
jgi:hypothetical protein